MSRAEGVVLRLQDACVASANCGRPFATLCSLVDTRLTSRISREELVHTAKMMDCALTHAEVDALRELMPEAFSSDGLIVNYQELNAVLNTYAPRFPSVFDADVSRSMSQSMSMSMSGAGGGARWNRDSTGSLPAYASPSKTTHIENFGRSSMMGHDMSRSIVTPAGVAIAAPGGDSRSNAYYAASSRGQAFTRSMPRGQGQLQGHSDIRRIQEGEGVDGLNDAYGHTMNIVAERVHAAIADRTRSRGAPLSLSRQFEAHDRSGSGKVAGRSFEGVLEEMGVFVSNSDLHTIYALFGRPEDDCIDYEAFCSWVMQCTPAHSPRGAGTGAGTGAGAGYGLDAAPPYAGPRVLQRLRELRQEGRDPFDIFEVHDLDRTGTVSLTEYLR
jgi:Ca2+-binding EF-hand superfamily protein